MRFDLRWLLATALAAPTLEAQLFHPAVTVPAGGVPGALVLAELDGQPGLDLALACGRSGVLSVLAGDGDGGFGPPQTLPAGAPTLSPVDVAAADFDGDGDLDLAMLNMTTVFLYENDGAGGFSAAGQHAVSGQVACWVLAADDDGDGLAELFISQPWLGGGLWRAANHGGWDFGPNVELYHSRVADPQRADLDGDGVDDFVFHRDLVREVVVLAGDGAGGYGPPSTWPVAAIGTAGPLGGLATGDLDDDGDLDVVLNEDYVGPMLIVLRGDAAGGFSAAEGLVYLADHYYKELIVADFDGVAPLDVANINDDGWNDFLLHPAVLPNEYFFPAGGSKSDLAANDLDGDGDTDVVLASATGDWVAVLLGARRAPAPRLSLRWEDPLLLLEWNDDTGGPWEVHRLATPWQAPDPSTLVATVPGSPWSDERPSDDAAGYYLVRLAQD